MELHQSVCSLCGWVLGSGGTFSELEAIPTEETMDGPLEPSVST